MRATTVIILILCFLIAGQVDSSAFWWRKKEETKQTPQAEDTKIPAGKVKKAKQAIKAPPGEEKVRQERELKQEKREQLNNTEWKIELNLFGGSERGKQNRDIITFENNQVVSANLSKQGFSSTNYSLTLQKDGSFIWETMQTSEKNGIAFWRGEVDSNIEKMQGMLSHRIDDKRAWDYSFRSLSKKAISAVAGED